MESAPAWRTLTSAVTVAPWNPELPCSTHAYAAFLHSVANALEALRAKRI
ncbi:hypothetical protein [Streptomyces sp. NBC_00878]|nr:hypothetical protein [Streptomyces sp. NBC_00878]MCX4905667.1 hypothetical protein [Streptomyces sp. NBC_00878]